MAHTPLTLELLCVISDATTALSYYWLTYQLLAFAINSKLIKLTNVLRNNKDIKKRQLFYMLLAVALLFAAFIALCGSTHALNVLHFFNPTYEPIVIARILLMVMCACVSVVTALIGSRLFPIILESLTKFELNNEGILQHAENYMIEVVEMVKESIIVLSENLRIIRCNEASSILLGAVACVDQNFVDFIHPHDLHIFRTGVSRVMGGFTAASQVTIEYRINQSAGLLRKKKIPTKSSKSWRGKSQKGSKIYIEDDVEEFAMSDAFQNNLSTHSSTVVPGSDHGPKRSSEPSVASVMTGDAADPNAADVFVWVESTICKGTSMNSSDEFEYNIMLVSRNIEDRKKLEVAQYNNIMKESEERARTNAAKLRYISCIAHDLKTPLQSFCFTLDLLGQTPLHIEQREYIQQANVAVDLMKLTISQTMDISKALTGAKLMPRRTTVYLSSMLHRVEVIITGYGKQVPISFEIAPKVNDRVITDEEWLWQMVLNLLTNACKYTDSGEIRVVLSLSNGSSKTRAFFEEKMLLVEVIDTGVGVADDKIGTMFDAFAQVQEGQVTGTGLGLFGVRTRAEGLLGTCGARHNTESSTGTGTVLWFAIPYIPDSSDGSPHPVRGVAYKRLVGITKIPTEPHLQLLLPSPRSELDAAGPDESAIALLIRERRLTAIVVDDTKTVCKLMERLLLNMGFESVACYANGSKGLDALMAGTVDIVFSDVQMPIMTGPEMIRRFRRFEAEALESGARRGRQLVVAVTANGSELGDCANNGFDEVCSKPLSVQDIIAVIEKYVL